MTDFNTEQEGRRLVLVDIDSFVAPLPTAAAVRSCMHALGLHIDRDRDLPVVACSAATAPYASFAEPTARHLWRNSPSAARRALLDVLREERVDSRFESLIVCSTARVFAEPIALLASRGVRVTVVAPIRSLSPTLRLAAHEVIDLWAHAWADDGVVAG